MAYNENNFDIDGPIVYIGMPERKTERFTFRIIVLEVQADRFVKQVKFMFINKNIDLLKEGFNVGDRVHINFQISGRYFKTKEDKDDWFVSLEARNISKL